MKKISKLLLIAIASITISSCQKTPVASITTDKTEYIAGETIKLTNTTTDGETFKWTFPDGTTGTTENYDYILNDTDPDATLTFKLEAFSKNGKKTNSTSKSVTVKAATGNVIFWALTGAASDVITVDMNATSRAITVERDSAPECGDAENAAFSNVKVGTYNYTATDGTDTWSGSVTVKKNTCTSIELQ